MKTKKFYMSQFFFSLLLCCCVISSCKKNNFLDTENNNQITWQQTSLDSLSLTALTVSPKGEVYAGTCEGIFRSPDQGESWERLDLICPAGIAVNSSGHIFVTAGAGVLRSLDNGLTWSSARLSAAGHTGPLAIGKTSDIVYSSVGISDENSFGGIYRSEDNGVTWMKTNFPDTIGVSVIAVNGHDDVFAGTGFGLFRSTNAGQSWQLLDVGFVIDYGPLIDAIAIDYDNRDIFIAIRNSGVYRSSDNGESWQKTGLSNTSVVTLLVSPVRSEFIFAGSHFQSTDPTKGIFYSADNGKNWLQINTGLTDLRIVQLAGDSLGFIYVATENSGVFRTVNPINK